MPPTPASARIARANGSSCALATLERGGPGGPELLNEAVRAGVDFDARERAELCSLYLEQAAGQISDLSLAIDGADALTVARLAHKLKGGSGAVGAARVAYLAAALEVAARAEDLSAAPELLGRLRTGLAETAAALSSS